MDSQHRHELQENDLEVFILNFKTWWAKHGNTVMIVVIVISLAILAKRYYDYRVEQNREEAWGGLSTATTPEICIGLAEDHSDRAFKAYAYLKAGDLYLGKSVGVLNAPTSAPASQPDKADVDQAGAMYQRVIELQGVPSLYTVNAQLGLASVYEARLQWDKARDLYNKIAQSTDASIGRLVELAKARVKALDRVSTPVVFAPSKAIPLPKPSSMGNPFDLTNPSLGLPGDGLFPLTPPDSPPATQPSL